MGIKHVWFVECRIKHVEPAQTINISLHSRLNQIPIQILKRKYPLVFLRVLHILVQNLSLIDSLGYTCWGIKHKASNVITYEHYAFIINYFSKQRCSQKLVLN